MLNPIYPSGSIQRISDVPRFPIQDWTDYFHNYGRVIVYWSSGSDLGISVDPDNPAYRVPGVRIYPQ